jgi:hypothetical protein
VAPPAAHRSQLLQRIGRARFEPARFSFRRVPDRFGCGVSCA